MYFEKGVVRVISDIQCCMLYSLSLSLSFFLSFSLPCYVKNTKLTRQINGSRSKQHQFREEREDKRKEEGGSKRHPYRIIFLLKSEVYVA